MFVVDVVYVDEHEVEVSEDLVQASLLCAGGVLESEGQEVVMVLSEGSRDRRFQLRFVVQRDLMVS